MSASSIFTKASGQGGLAAERALVENEGLICGMVNEFHGNEFRLSAPEFKPHVFGM